MQGKDRYEITGESPRTRGMVYLVKDHKEKQTITMTKNEARENKEILNAINKYLKNKKK